MTFKLFIATVLFVEESSLRNMAMAWGWNF